MDSSTEFGFASFTGSQTAPSSSSSEVGFASFPGSQPAPSSSYSEFGFATFSGSQTSPSSSSSEFSFASSSGSQSSPSSSSTEFRFPNSSGPLRSPSSFSIAFGFANFSGPQPLPSSSSSGFKRPVEMTSQTEEAKLEPPHQSDLYDDNLKQLLVHCARALSENELEEFDLLVGKARSLISISGEPVQRLGAYMFEGLIARKESSETKIYDTLRCKEPSGKDLLSYMHIFYEICPYLKFGYMAANGAIGETCKNEDRIHIIDFQLPKGPNGLYYCMPWQEDQGDHHL